MIEYLLLICAIPLGIFAKLLTENSEKRIYQKYFKIITPLLLIGILISIFVDHQITFTCLFAFIFLLVWNR